MFQPNETVIVMSGDKGAEREAMYARVESIEDTHGVSIATVLMYTKRIGFVLVDGEYTARLVAEERLTLRKAK